MGVFGSKVSVEAGVEEQIRVLATNIEVLNQKLIADPNAAITPGEALIKKQLLDTIQKLDALEQYLRNNQANTGRSMMQGAGDLKTAFLQIKQAMDGMPQERHALQEEIKRLNEVITSLSKMDKEWLGTMLTNLDTLNKNTTLLNKNMVNFYNHLLEDMGHRIDTISQEAASRIFKNMVWFIAAIVVLSLLFTLVFVKLFI